MDITLLGGRGIRKEFCFFVGTQAVVMCRTADAKIIIKNCNVLIVIRRSCYMRFSHVQFQSFRYFCWHFLLSSYFVFPLVLKFDSS
jgi:hypothetical protein